MIKKENKSFTIEEILIAFLLFLISLGAIFNSYSAIIRTHLISLNQLSALQNLKSSLDRIYIELKSGENISTTYNSINFINTQDCTTRTISFVTSSDNIGYLVLIKNNSTISLTDLNLVDIRNFKIATMGIINTSNPTKNNFLRETDYYISSTKSVTFAITANNILNKNIYYPINIQLTVQPFNSAYKIPVCRFLR